MSPAYPPYGLPLGAGGSSPPVALGSSRENLAPGPSPAFGAGQQVYGRTRLPCSGDVEVRIVRIRRGGTVKDTVESFQEKLEEDGLLEFQFTAPLSERAVEIYHVELWRRGDSRPLGFCGFLVEEGGSA
ncbi:MAG: hypothetical protein HY319_22185 [Armatimonadetes bacterium]|nr:hypothetical protein [Armatimonadota bacterium]